MSFVQKSYCLKSERRPGLDQLILFPQNKIAKRKKRQETIAGHRHRVAPRGRLSSGSQAPNLKINFQRDPVATSPREALLTA